MKLSKKSLWVRWAYLEYIVFYQKERPQEYVIPAQTDFCTLFWRSVIITPLFSLFLTTAILVAMILLVCVGPWILIGWILGRVFKKKVRVSVLAQWFRDFKNRTCTKVDIE